MDKFGDAYREAVDELPKFRMDADKAADELHHYRMLKQGRKYIIIKGCTAAAVFLLCGVGTVAARSFRDSVIRVNDNGFVITSENALEEANRKGIPTAASILKAGGVFSTEDGIPEGEDKGIEAYGNVEEMEEDPVEEYDSLDDFYAGSGVVAPIPDEELLGREFSSERIYVMEGGRQLFVHLSDDDVGFSLSQADNRGYESYSAATAYMGQSCNERSVTNSQGLNYAVFDTVDENGIVISVHAVISINGRDLTLSFEGFEEATIERVLNQLDLSVYFQEE